MKKVKKNKIVLTLLLAGVAASAHAQANATASRAGDLQVGLGFTSATSSYLTNDPNSGPNFYFTNRLRGLAFYSDFDFREHWGVEVDFHQLNSPVTGDVYERSYEAGGRYLRHYGRFTPYGKALYGRGVFNFFENEANLAYNMAVGGVGVDIAVHPRVNVRVDYEYQHWFGFEFTGLNPQLVTVGAAYHFGGGKPR